MKQPKHNRSRPVLRSLSRDQLRTICGGYSKIDATHPASEGGTTITEREQALLDAYAKTKR